VKTELNQEENKSCNRFLDVEISSVCSNRPIQLS
jgi:hypothetical protein